MGKLVGVAVAGLLMASSARVDAETRYQTAWFFRVDYLSTGQFSDSTDATTSGPIMMPLASRWTCERKPAALTKAGNVMAGFSCTSGVGVAAVFVNVLAVCSATETAEDRSTAAVGDSVSSSVVLTARCRTTSSSPTPPRAADKSL